MTKVWFLVLFLIFFPDPSTVPTDCYDGAVRLVNSRGTVGNEGRVEVCIGKVWGSVCYATSNVYYSNTWDMPDAKVVCSQLGHLKTGA